MRTWKRTSLSRSTGAFFKYSLLAYCLLAFAHPAGAQDDTSGLTLSLPVDTTQPAPIFFGFSPAMIGQRQWEFILFNVMATQKVDFTRDSMTTRFRNTSAQHLLQVTYGITRNRRLNAGVDLQYLHTRSDSDPGSSPFKVFGNDTTSGKSYHTLSAVGLRLRALPFRKVPEFTIQSAIYFPTAGSGIPKVELDVARIQWFLQLAFYQQFRPWLYGFAGLTGSVKFANDTQKQTTYALPVNLTLMAEVIRRRVYLYPSLNYSANFEGSPLKRRGSQFTYGLGAQYYPSPHFTLNLEFQFPIKIELNSLTSESVPGSYTLFNLGFRYLTGVKEKGR